MRAVWSQVISEFRVAALRRGVELPQNSVADDAWHRCEGGAYRLNSQLPFFAFFAADGRLPVVWRHDAQRLLNMHQEALIAAALAECPIKAETPRAAAPPVSVETEPAIKQPQREQAQQNAGARLPSQRDEPTRPALLGAAPSTDKAPHRALAKAQTFLVTLLTRRSRPTLEIRRRASNAALSWITVRRAASALGVVVARKGFGPNGNWSWALPK